MKIGLITDTHWGARGDSEAFINYTKNFLDEVFFPKLKEQGIKVVFHLGDLVERRKYINFMTAHRMKKDFFERLEQEEIDIHIIAGNHDTFFKQTNKVNALRELLVRKYQNVHVYSEPTEVEVDGTKILMLPWINDENREYTFKRIKNTRAQICFGHLHLNKFEMFKGHVIEDGEDPSLFQKFDMVLTGHYHHKSSKDNIHYLGSILQTDWGDFDDPRGFHIFDTDDRSLTYIRNPFDIFQKVFYDDKDKVLDDLLSEDYSKLKDCYVKVIVQEKTNSYWFDLFMEHIEKVGAQDLQIVEDHHNLGDINEEEILSGTQDTITFFNTTVDQMDDPAVNKPQLKSLLTELYREAMTQ